jgi:spore coat polysaccharide biosynthesis predicted glycosyltransferase SpsG
MTQALFVIDAGPTIGLGHLRRSLRLMEALKTQGVTCRLMLPGNTVLARGWDLAWEPWPTDLFRLPAADMIVADSNRLAPSVVEAWAGLCRLRVVFDDLAARVLPADVVINHNLYAGDLDYSPWGAKRVLAGLDWLMVDSAFVVAKSKRNPKALSRILVSFGGTDATAGPQTVKALLAANAEVEVDLVIPPGAAPPDFQHERMRLLMAPDMAEAMTEIGLYVGGAGVSALEATTAGLSLAVCAFTRDQLLATAYLRRYGVVAQDSFNPTALAESSLGLLSSGSIGNPFTNLIDGKGPERAAAAVLNQLTIAV